MIFNNDVCKKMGSLEEKICCYREQLHKAVENNNGDLLAPEVIKASTILDIYISKYTYLCNIENHFINKVQISA